MDVGAFQETLQYGDLKGIFVWHCRRLAVIGTKSDNHNISMRNLIMLNLIKVAHNQNEKARRFLQLCKDFKLEHLAEP